MSDLQQIANIVQIVSGVIAVLGFGLALLVWFYPQPSSAPFKAVFKFLRPVLLPVILVAVSFWLGTLYVTSRTNSPPAPPPAATTQAEAQTSAPVADSTAPPTSAPANPTTSAPVSTQEQKQLPEVICSVSGRTAVPTTVPCNQGALSVSIQVIGRTEYPNWEGAFNGLVSQLDAEPGVTVVDRVELYGPPGKWDTLEVAGSLTLQGSNNMTENVNLLDERTSSVISMRPDNISQELQLKFAPTIVGKVVTICEFANPCSGQIMTFTYQP